MFFIWLRLLLQAKDNKKRKPLLNNSLRFDITKDNFLS